MYQVKVGISKYPIIFFEIERFLVLAFKRIPYVDTEYANRLCEWQIFMNVKLYANADPLKTYVLC